MFRVVQDRQWVQARHSAPVHHRVQVMFELVPVLPVFLRVQLLQVLILPVVPVLQAIREGRLRQSVPVSCYPFPVSYCPPPALPVVLRLLAPA